MPWGLKRFQQAHHLHFITFSCYHRAPLLATPQARCIFEKNLEAVRNWYGLHITGNVVMPEHVHLLISEPERKNLATAIQMLKQNVARELHRPICHTPFWQQRYYDFNVWTENKRIEKLRYLHRNPVERGLVRNPEDWEWSSFRHYLFGIEGPVEIESQWSASKREQRGEIIRVLRPDQNPPLCLQKAQPQGRGTPLRDCSQAMTDEHPHPSKYCGLQSLP